MKRIKSKNWVINFAILKALKFYKSYILKWMSVILGLVLNAFTLNSEFLKIKRKKGVIAHKRGKPYLSFISGVLKPERNEYFTAGQHSRHSVTDSRHRVYFSFCTISFCISERERNIIHIYLWTKHAV